MFTVLKIPSVALTTSFLLSLRARANCSSPLPFNIDEIVNSDLLALPLNIHMSRTRYKCAYSSQTIIKIIISPEANIPLKTQAK